MSGYPGGSNESNNGLDSLFAQLRQQQSKPVNLDPSYSYYPNNNSNYFGQPAQAPGYQPPSVTSAVPTPPIPPNSQPHHGSDIMSPVETPAPRPAVGAGASNGDRTSSLLNLLKFSQPSGASSSQPAPIGTPLLPSREPSGSYAVSDPLGHASGSSRGGSDLLAALMGSVQSKPVQHSSPSFTTSNRQAAFGAPAPPPSADTQAYLLQLLNQPKPSQSDDAPSLQSAKDFTPASKASPQEDVGELSQALEEASLENNMMGASAAEGIAFFGNENPRGSATKSGIFSYVNPFDQLAASSPRNRTPKLGSGGSSSSVPAMQILKHPRHDSPETKESISSPAHTRRKLDDVPQKEPSPPTSSADGHNQIEALTAISASVSKENKETVHEALSEVGGQVNKEVQEAIARAESDLKITSIEDDLRSMLEAKTEKEFQENAQIAAKSIKEELEKEENSNALDGLPEPVAEAVKDIIDEAAHGHVADSWESADAEDSPTKDDEGKAIRVYSFPMRPWISIAIKESEEPRPTFRDEAVMDIARLKKEFDQIDRTLVTASNSFIVYGMSKNGGVRIIRQDDGKDARLFTETHDRIFTVVISASGPDQKEAIIATGISGTVYWALIKDGEGDHIEDSNPEMHGFALPPIQTLENESPGGVLKTRARKSSSHPDFFAVGRGKFIHIIWPSVILKQSFLKHGMERIVDTDKYLASHSLKINTGKAGKDFAFSEDDTTIVSLDKAGRVKFWDIRSLTKADLWATQPEQVELKDPLITLTTTPASEKSWPTSVLLVDKLRPYQRGCALRYLIVGMKQNHTLQLWDLALQKPVQEIHLPHNKESDAVCSVVYHAATSIIVVGHPTRNSVYFLHLSAPKYNLPKAVTQAEFMAKIVSKDPLLPKPESTAVISGMREYSFANKGMLRSIDILQTPNSTAPAGEPQTQFELYAMHSRGVTCLNIKQADLGWTVNNKVIDEVDGLESGMIAIDTLKELPVTPAPEVVEVTKEPATTFPTRIVPRPAPKETAQKESPKKGNAGEASAPKEEKVEKKESPVHVSATPVTGAGKKNRRKATATESSGPPATAQASKSIILDPSSSARNGSLSRVNTATSMEAGSAPQEMSDAALKSIETRISGEVKKLIDSSLSSLLSNIKDDRRTQNAVAEAKQDAMLRLVSATLSDNIEVTLDRIVSGSIEKSVLPLISDVTIQAVNEQLSAKLTTHMTQNLPKELQKALPDAISRALQQPQLLKLMSESLAKSVAFRVEEQFAHLLQNKVAPAFTNLAVQAAQKVAADVHRDASATIEEIYKQRQADSSKIEQLTQLVTGLTSTISSMAAAQTEFQAQFLRMQQQLAIDRREAAARHSEGHASRPAESRSSTALTAPVEKSAADIEYEAMMDSIVSTMDRGDYENAIIQWLQTRREQEFFQHYFSKFNPHFIRDLSPLLLLSLGATISLDFEDENLLDQRIAWMETILASFQLHVSAGNIDDQVRELIPKIMGIYVQRLEHLFMRVSQRAANDPLLKRLSVLVTAANRILETSGQAHRAMGAMQGSGIARRGL